MVTFSSLIYMEKVGLFSHHKLWDDQKVSIEMSTDSTFGYSIYSDLSIVICSNIYI